MKNKTRLLILTIMSAVLTIYFLFMTYKFNPKYRSLSKILFVSEYRESGGKTLILILLALLTLFTLVFIKYVYIDSRQTEVFSQSGNPEYYRKNNHYSIVRIFQYYSITSAFLSVTRDAYRIMVFEDYIMSLYIFKTDIIFLMMDIISLLFFIVTITLLIEYIDHVEIIDFSNKTGNQ